MALTITHPKTNTITDWTQAQLDAQIALGNFPPGTTLSQITLPSDWNASHTVTGTLGFDATASGTNTTATMVVGTGASLSATGSGTIVSTSTTGNAATVTTNANLTGPITSVGNATSIASQTGTGTKFVVDTGPTITGATLTTSSVNGVTLATGTTNQIAYYSAAGTIVGNANFTSTSTGTSVLGASTSVAAMITINTNINGGITLNSSNANGPGFNLNQTTNTNFQFFSNTGFFGVYNATLNATILACSGGTNAVIQTVSGGCIGFNNNAGFPNSGSFDTGMSRSAAGVFAFGTGAQNNQTATLLAGDHKATVAGKGFFVKEGTNAKMGQATLVAGTLTVATTAVNANSRIFLSVETAGGVQGNLSYTKINGTSFTINSTSAAETSVVNWLIMEAA